MCGQFTQYHSREEHMAFLGEEAERAAEKLRGERQFCRYIAVFVKTSPFAVNEPYYGNVVSEKLMTPTQDTMGIIAAMFDDTQPRSNSNQLMKVVDRINHSGLGKVWFAGRGIASLLTGR